MIILISVEASKKGDTKEVERLLAQEGINVDIYNWVIGATTPLLLASRYGHKEIVRNAIGGRS